MTTDPSRASTTCVAVDARTRDHAGAEHLVHLLDTVLPAAGPGYVASTHVVPGEAPHTAVAASWPSIADPALTSEQLLELVADQVDELPGLDEAGVVVHGPEGTVSRGADDLVAGALRASGEHRDRSAGRLARFPGRADVERRCTVAEVLALSAVDAVEALAGTEVEPTTLLDLTEWARPTWRGGRAVLLVQPGHSGLVPFESRHQIPCCSRH
ncbi:hypothetical protein [Nocardioides sp. SYSU D00065]|uniref:hypothetical protein n=1 Tax=Nocardioides sp. SYSU D00065 TaxID=2817378 RepID=UPI001B33A7FF|nr:hypothetical protein [Nocardioides sp. SYSU D00065]